MASNAKLNRRTLYMGFLGGASVTTYSIVFLVPFPLATNIDRWHQSIGTLTHYDPVAMRNFAAGVFLSFVFYALGLGVINAPHSPKRVDWIIVILGAMAFSIVLLFSYPIFSTDVFDNIMHGRILGIYGENPFMHSPMEFPKDLAFKHTMWQLDPSAYGPLWESLAGGLARVAGESLLANVLIFKATSILAFIVDAGLIGLFLHRISPKNTLKGVYLFTWNPLILIMTAGDGHNDSVMMSFVLGGLYLASHGRWLAAILCQVLGALVKFMPIALLPLFFVAGLHQIPRKCRWRFIALTIGTVLLLVGASYLPFWEGIGVLRIGRRRALLTSSAPTLAYLLSINWLPAPAGRSIVSWWALLGFGFLEFSLTKRVYQTEKRSSGSHPANTHHTQMKGEASPVHHAQFLVKASTMLLLGYLLGFCLWFWPWYLVWIVPLAALLPLGILPKGILLFSFTAIWKPLVLVYWRQLSDLPTLSGRQLGLIAVTMLIPWIYFGTHRIRQARSHKNR